MRWVGILPFLLFVVAPASLMAEQGDFSCSGGKALAVAKGREVVQHVQEAYSKVASLSASFSQDSFVSALEISEMSSGTVWFTRPGKMKWLYLSPEEQTFLVRDGTLWYYQKSENQLVIDDFKDRVISDLPVAFLMGLGNLSRDFNLLRACPGAVGTILEFAPGQTAQSTPSSSLKAFKLLVGDDFYPRGAAVTDVGGNTTSILLSGLSVNVKVPEDTFAASFPKGGDINDRRKNPGA